MLIRPAEVVDIMNSDSDDEEASRKKKAPRISDQQFMSWVRGTSLGLDWLLDWVDFNIVNIIVVDGVGLSARVVDSVVVFLGLF